MCHMVKWLVDEFFLVIFCLIPGTASPKDAFSDWEAAIKYWAPEDGRFGEEDLRAFFTFASATILADDEFRLLVSSIG